MLQTLIEVLHVIVTVRLRSYGATKAEVASIEHARTRERTIH